MNSAVVFLGAFIGTFAVTIAGLMLALGTFS